MASYNEKQEDLQPFLRSSVDSLVEEEEIQHRSNPARLRSLLPVLSHIVLIGIYTMVSVVLIRRASSNQSPSRNLVYSPAQEAYHFETQVFDASGVRNKTLFGSPSEAIDKGWEDLLELANVRYSAEEVVKLETQDVIQLPDGDYFGSLWVFHQLHCLKQISRLLYPEHYFPNYTKKEKAMLEIHMIHCLDTIREDIMCHADITPLTFHWGSRQEVPVGNFNGQHQCASWEGIENWSRKRMFDPFEPGVMVHPVFGPAYAHLGDNRLVTSDDEA